MVARDGCDKPVSAPRQCLDKPGIVGGVAQRLAQFVDRRVQAVIKIDESIGRPDRRAQLFPGYYLAGMLQQQREHMEGLLLKLDPYALLAQFARPQVKLKRSEVQDRGWLGLKSHGLFRPRIYGERV